MNEEIAYRSPTTTAPRIPDELERLAVAIDTLRQKSSQVLDRLHTGGVLSDSRPVVAVSEERLMMSPSGAGMANRIDNLRSSVQDANDTLQDILDRLEV